MSEWPYHKYEGNVSSKQGTMVPCKSNPCKIHGGTDVYASSPEEAYEKANQLNSEKLGIIKSSNSLNNEKSLILTQSSPSSRLKIKTPSPMFMAQHNSLKNNIIAKKKKESLLENLKQERLKPQLSDTEKTRLRNNVKELLKNRHEWIYDSPVFKGYTTLSSEQLAKQLYPNAIQGDEAEKELKQQADNTFSNKLNYHERFAVKDYSEVGYKQVNKALNNHLNLSDRDNALIKGVDKAIKVNEPLKHNVILYRYAHSDDESRSVEESKYYRSVSDGDNTVIRESYTSTTLQYGSFMKDYENHENTEFIILAKKGTKGLFMSNSRYNEHEFILPRDIKTKVVSIYETGEMDGNGNWRRLKPIIILEIIQ